MSRSVLAIPICLLLPGFAGGQNVDWVQAEREIVRLKPAAFSNVPAHVRSQLNQRGCTIPQPFAPYARGNIVQGKFASSTQTDWAALCSRNGVSEIVIFWGGKSRCPDLARRSPDRNWLQGTGPGKAGYSRGLFAVDSTFILTHYREYGGPKPPPLEHQGLDEAFIEKASRTYYCYRGKWLVLQGRD